MQNQQLQQQAQQAQQQQQLQQQQLAQQQLQQQQQQKAAHERQQEVSSAHPLCTVFLSLSLTCARANFPCGNGTTLYRAASPYEVRISPSARGAAWDNHEASVSCEFELPSAVL